MSPLLVGILVYLATTFYRWKREYAKHGDKGLINSKPCPQNPTLRVDPAIEEKILYLRKNYHFGQARISWYLDRYHDMKVSRSGVYSVLCCLTRLLSHQTY